MHVHWFQHVPFEGLGSIEPWMRAQGHALSSTRLYAGELPPSRNTHDWLIVMGGPMNIYQEKEYPWLAPEKQAIRAAIDGGQKVLGICLGAQLLADVLGGHVSRSSEAEIGWFPVELTVAAGDSQLFAGFPRRFDAFHWHGDQFEVPPGAAHVARSQACEAQAFAWHESVVGLQFHLETMPDGAGKLIDHARHEIIPAPYIQDADAMLENPARFTRSNELMGRLLSNMDGP